MTKSNNKLQPNERIAVFPGSFDPFTIGHYSIVNRALAFVDKIVVAIGVNGAKHTLFDLNTRKNIIHEAFANEPRVIVDSYDQLTVDYAKEVGASIILRGIRSIQDFEYEKTIADANRQISGIDTILLFTEPQHSFISSTVVRDVFRYGKDVAPFMPPGVDISKLEKK
ncbi:MAG: pantetheine-phosphate adenylyltransferase [Paludibacteraceae bacterium]|nr:pantetheine-phosphate adenylyltransferase [Paludibacteraceae bacterium]